MLRIFAGIFELRVIEREFRRCNGKLRITVKPLQTVRHKEFLGIPIVNLTATTHVEGAGIEACDVTDAALLG